VSFNVYGERGIIDLLARHRARRALLVIELKTELVDPNELLGSMDRRLASPAGSPRIAADRHRDGQRLAVIAESRMNRRHAGAVRSLLRAAFPEDGRAVRRWLRDPDRRQLAMFFLSDSAQGSAVLHLAPRKRVRRTASAGKWPDYASAGTGPESCAVVPNTSGVSEVRPEMGRGDDRRRGRRRSGPDQSRSA
jgi:hypothetical protein